MRLKIHDHPIFTNLNCHIPMVVDLSHPLMHPVVGGYTPVPSGAGRLCNSEPMSVRHPPARSREPHAAAVQLLRDSHL